MHIKSAAAMQSPDRTEGASGAASSVQAVTLSEASGGNPQGAPLLGANFQLIQNVKVKLSASLGESELSVGELFALKEGSVVELNRLTNDPVDILLDGQVVARGRLVVVDDNFGVSITEIANLNQSGT